MILIIIIIIIIIIIKDHDDRKSLYSISRQSMKFSRELGVPAIPLAEDEAHTTYAAEQRPRPNLPPGSPTAQVQVGIKITARQITIAKQAETRAKTRPTDG